MSVRVTKRGRNYTYDLIKDGKIIDQRASTKRYNYCMIDGRYYVDIANVKPRDISKLLTITHNHHEGIDRNPIQVEGPEEQRG